MCKLENRPREQVSSTARTHEQNLGNIRLQAKMWLVNGSEERPQKVQHLLARR